MIAPTSLGIEPVIYAIYNNPADFPGKYVVRKWNGEAPGSSRVCHTLEEARSAIPRGLTNIGRHVGDDPCIEECWL